MITVSTASCSNRDPTLLLALIGLFIKGNTFTKATKWTDHIFSGKKRHVRVSCWSVWLSPYEAIISNAPKKQQMDCHEKCALCGNLEFSLHCCIPKLGPMYLCLESLLTFKLQKSICPSNKEYLHKLQSSA